MLNHRDFFIRMLYKYAYHSIYMREAQVYATPLAAVVAHILAVHRQRTWRP